MIRASSPFSICFGMYPRVLTLFLTFLNAYRELPRASTRFLTFQTVATGFVAPPIPSRRFHLLPRDSTCIHKLPQIISHSQKTQSVSAYSQAPPMVIHACLRAPMDFSGAHAFLRVSSICSARCVGLSRVSMSFLANQPATSSLSAVFCFPHRFH